MTELAKEGKELAKLPTLVRTIAGTLLPTGAPLPLIDTLKLIDKALGDIRKEIKKLEIKTAEVPREGVLILDRLQALKIGQTVGVKDALVALEEAARITGDVTTKDTKKRIADVTAVVNARGQAFVRVRKELDETLALLARGVGGEITVGQVTVLSDVVFGVGKGDRGAPSDQLHALANALRTATTTLTSVMPDMAPGGSLTTYVDEAAVRLTAHASLMKDIFLAFNLGDAAAPGAPETLSKTALDIRQKTDALLLQFGDISVEPNASISVRLAKITEISIPIMDFFRKTAWNSVLAVEFQERWKEGDPELRDFLLSLVKNTEILTGAFVDFQKANTSIFDALDEFVAEDPGRTIPTLQDLLRSTHDAFITLESLLGLIENQYDLQTENLLMQTRVTLVTKTLQLVMNKLTEDLPGLVIRKQVVSAIQDLVEERSGEKRRIREPPETKKLPGGKFGGKRRKRDVSFSRVIAGVSNIALLSAFTEFCSTLLFDATI